MDTEPPVPPAAEPPRAGLPAGDDGHNGEAPRPSRLGSKGVAAVLLAIAAVMAAAIGARASIVSSDASDAWQSALRTEVKRSVAAVNDVSFLYLTEYPQAMRVLPARLIGDALRAAGAGQGKAVAQALEDEAALQLGLVDALAATNPLTADSTYVLPSGGFDLGKRLAVIRLGGSEGSELLALDPDGLVATGDRRADKAVLLASALIPIGLCAFLGILAVPLRHRRRMLLAGGVIVLICGAAMALAVEVLT